MKTNTIVIHHSADFDGIFCREIARKFLPNAELIGWDFADPPLEIPDCFNLYVMDLPLDAPFGFKWDKEVHSIKFFKGNVFWIDHHKSAIETHPKNIEGFRIDGVAACRLAWQYFSIQSEQMACDDASQWPKRPNKEDFVNRTVIEPLAVRLAGEYDIWDHRDNDADIAFQFGLDAQEKLDWKQLLLQQLGEAYTLNIVDDGRAAMRCYAKRDADIMRSRGFRVHFEGLDLLCLNTARCNSNTFAALDKPGTGHDALCGFYWNGKKWTISLYHAAHRKDIDLSLIAVKHGGGGHRGACGFHADKLPFLP